MSFVNRGWQLLNAPLVALPALHLLLLVLSLFRPKTDVIGLRPIMFIDIPFSLFMMVRDDWPTVGITLGIFGSAWWYFIGRIGWIAHKHTISRRGSALGAALILFVCGMESIWLFREGFLEDLQDGRLFAADIFLYTLAGILLAGGLVSATYAAIAAFRGEKAG